MTRTPVDVRGRAEAAARHQRKNAPGVPPRPQWKNIGCVSVVWALAATAAPLAQTSKSITIQVAEVTGIRRTEYPVSARVEIPKAVLADLDHVRLHAADADVPAQYSIESRWEDGSARTLGIDFNVSVGPAETRTYAVDYGPAINRPASV